MGRWSVMTENDPPGVRRGEAVTAVTRPKGASEGWEMRIRIEMVCEIVRMWL